MGHDGIMTPEEAHRFYEEDEDPNKIFAKFDAGPKNVTTPPPYVRQGSAGNVSIYVQAIGLYRELRRKMLPVVSAAGPRSYGLGGA
jgi:hypothetical protein